MRYRNVMAHAMLICTGYTYAIPPLNTVDTNTFYTRLQSPEHTAPAPCEQQSHNEQLLSVQDYTTKAEKASQTGNHAQAIYYCKEALKQHNTAAVKAHIHHILGNAHSANKAYNDALKAYKEALACDQTDAGLHYAYGLCLEKTGNIDGAIASMQEAINVRQAFGEALVVLGRLYLRKGDQQNANIVLSSIMQLTVITDDMLCEVGALYRELRRHNEAIEVFRAVQARTPTNMHAKHQLANTLCLVGEYEAALALYQEIYAQHRYDAGILYNIGFALFRLDRVYEAIEMFIDTINQRPDDAKAHFGLAQCYLALGYYERGWQEYEWRWDAFGEKQVQQPGTQWYQAGNSLQGKRVLVLGEQGYGDMFLFIRFAKTLKDRGASYVACVTYKELRDIIKVGCPYIDNVYAYGETAPTFDVQMNLMSLPLLLGINSMPTYSPYMVADKQYKDYWSKKMDADTDYKVGLCWHGNSVANDVYIEQFFASRSLDSTLLEPLLNTSGCSFYSLQRDQAVSSCFSSSRLSRMKLPDEPIDQEHGRFIDTAAIIANLDLVITIDTSVAHLAAAMGKPTWILLPKPTDWRWMLGRADSPWYPQALLLRQEKPGDWGPVIEKARSLLVERVGAHLRKKLLPRSAARVLLTEPASSQSSISPFEDIVHKVVRAVHDPNAWVNVSTLLLQAGIDKEISTLYMEALRKNPSILCLTQALITTDQLLGLLEQELRTTNVQQGSDSWYEKASKAGWLLEYKKHLSEELKGLNI